MRKYIDIGVNLTDPQFRGIYRGKQRHPDDLSAILDRARKVGVSKILVTGSSLLESREAELLAKQHPGFLWSTFGVHPCNAADEEVNQPDFFTELEASARQGIAAGVVKAYGEFGLDYDRLHYAPANDQRRVFAAQLDIAARLKLPLFLHSRSCADDFYAMLAPYVLSHGLNGVVHSFTGTASELQKLLDLGLFIGVNGCSLKTPENLEVVRQIPLARLMLETDAPWCEIRRTHASYQYIEQGTFESVPKPERWREGSMVRGRCEPCGICNVAEAVAAVHGVPVDLVAEAAYSNAENMFKFERRSTID